MEPPTILQGCPLAPNISSIVGNNDVLRPSKEQENIALEKSRAYWYHIASIAHAYLDHGLAPEFIDPHHALYKVPRFQSPLKSQEARPFGNTPIWALCSLATSNWRLSSDCDAVKKERARLAVVQIGTSRTIPYSFYGKVFSDWIGTTMEKKTGPNYLGILAIGWCYILSAQLLEMQGGSAVMHYTNSLADCLGESSSSPSEEAHYIDVGAADDRIARWWSAILAKREGWKAIVKNEPDEFVAPWSVSRTCETSFIIKRSDSQHGEQTPLSSDEAFDALLKFAHSHDVGSQFSIALTIAMSLPMHRYYGTDVKLPPPRAHGSKLLTTTHLDVPPTWMQLKTEMPYYMTLSCSPEVMISTLCGSFWQPQVPCNMASQWLHPVLEEVLGEVADTKSQEVLALIGAIRRPSVGALWIGAAVSGIGPKLVERVSGNMQPLDLNVFPWTGAPQSFMDGAGIGPYTWGDPEYISRTDIWRLLNLSPTEENDWAYENRPMTPWEPCGACLIANCALRVTSHLKCARHEYRYDHWSWELENGETIHDYGFLNAYPSLLTAELSNIPDSRTISHSFEKKELDPKRTASEEASVGIFLWFIVGGEGIPPEKIYQDDLLREVWEDVLGDGSGLACETHHGKSPESGLRNMDRLETWLDTSG
ncbi:hypothetical protein P170DRAFT_506221 [Aspergillus steynii IBT 23096]|uniref:Uncharacterized protein n=1 Tax=Aspergillus steynii IBT 23096 TaxID=1392250 RepID=A0A2I2GS12_9EURO|nr:uncharacterized protein P170DRAFT_506221 [Aspergillus steynii IBT 23096]PLB55666.1 hypothetical protein P170DRAFT_506221 [Aspergillus steynii IBT 23096]